jgi:predicted nucleic acid-binding protein
MDTLLIDTNIISFLLKGDSRIAFYEPHLKNKQLAISFMSVAELYQWAIIKNWGEKRIRLLECKLQEDYLVLPCDITTCQHWAKVRALCQSQGKPISTQDAWIAATALQFQLVLATHNPKDFIAIDDLALITAVDITHHQDFRMGRHFVTQFI